MNRFKVRRARKIIARDRCPRRPGITHLWDPQYRYDASSDGLLIVMLECVKCGKVETH